MDLQLQPSPQLLPENVPYMVEVSEAISEEGYVIVLGNSFQISASGDLAVVDNLGHRLFGVRAGYWTSIYELRRDFEDVSPNFITSPTDDGWITALLMSIRRMYEEDQDSDNN